jgi:hypothetical protein
MRENTRCCHTVVLLSLLLVVTVLGACGNSSKKSTSPATAPVPGTSVVGMRTCTTCHTAAATDWLTSKHANVNNSGDLNSPGSPTIVQIGSCAVNCHDPNGDSNNLIAGYTGNVPRPVVGCEACHGGGSRHAEAGGIGPIGFVSIAGGPIGTTQVSAQFNTCTSCHELLDSSGTGTNPSPAHLTAAPTGTQYSITETHFAVAKNGGAIAGYAMDFSSETVCTDCHNPHKNADINRQWAKSLKADKTASLWNRNWSVNNPSCFRCHTTTGFIAYANALGSGNSALAQQLLYGSLSTSPIPSAPTWKAEMLLCTACHTDNKGTLRNPGAYTASYIYNIYGSAGTVPTIYSVASHAYPDIGNSNHCMLCHVGRQGGDTIKNMNSGAVTAWDFSNNTVLSNHNLQAGGMMFRGVGYNYEGRDYSNPPQFMHDKIGTFDSVPATGTNGPCVRCHMTSPDGTSNHLFPLLSSTTTTVNGVARIVITSNPYGICSTCHGTNPVELLNLISQSKNNYIDAQSALAKAMESVDLYRRGTSFYRARDTQTISAGTATATNGSPVILGTRTNWSSVGLEAGDIFRIDADGIWYNIASIDTPTQITLATAFTGTSVSNVAYTIRKNETVTVTTGITTVTGSGTNWISTSGMITAGDKFRIDSDGTWYTIASVDTDTQITLASTYAGLSTTTTEFTLRNNTTASVATSSPTVTIAGADLLTLDVSMPGSGTTGDYFRVDSDGTWYRITNRTSTTLTLASGYSGSTASGAAYTIIRSNANRDWLTRGDVDSSGNSTGKNTMGAAFNLNSLANSNNDPGAYIHNPFYARKLIYDSIDWLDDGVMNYSTGTTLKKLCTVTTTPYWCTGAMSYLLPFGVVGGGISAERP